MKYVRNALAAIVVANLGYALIVGNLSVEFFVGVSIGAIGAAIVLKLLNNDKKKEP
jgi:predicted acylesterase/phospholipase RssA